MQAPLPNFFRKAVRPPIKNIMDFPLAYTLSCCFSSILIRSKWCLFNLKTFLNFKNSLKTPVFCVVVQRQMHENHRKLFCFYCFRVNKHIIMWNSKLKITVICLGIQIKKPVKVCENTRFSWLKKCISLLNLLKSKNVKITWNST